MVMLNTNIMDKKDLISNSDEHRESRGLVSIARGWVYIHGLVLSSYCYLFLFIMAFLFLLGGGLLTAISFRPQEVRERLGEWSYPIATSPNTRIAGPGLLILGVLMAIISLVLCQASRRLYATRLNVLPCVVAQPPASHLTANLALAADRGDNLKEVSVFSVVQNRDKSFFTDGCSEKSELLIGSDIACFPGANTPRSITPIGAHWTNHSMNSDHVTNAVTPIGEPWTNHSDNIDHNNDSYNNQPTFYDQNILVSSESKFKSMES